MAAICLGLNELIQQDIYIDLFLAGGVRFYVIEQDSFPQKHVLIPPNL